MKIKYFAWIKEITNKDYEIIKSNFPEDISALKLKLIKSYPDLKKHIDSDVMRFAVNLEYTSVNLKLSSSDEIGIFPPVSGG